METETETVRTRPDVARSAALGTPALNYVPGDPVLAHTAGEYVPVAQLRACEERLAEWLTEWLTRGGGRATPSGTW